jgi:hypothetical protein
MNCVEESLNLTWNNWLELRWEWLDIVGDEDEDEDGRQRTALVE